MYVRVEAIEGELYVYIVFDWNSGFSGHDAIIPYRVAMCAYYGAAKCDLLDLSVLAAPRATGLWMRRMSLWGLLGA